MKEADAKKVLAGIEKLRLGKIKLVKRKREVDPPPAALNTVEMLKMASKILGMGAHQTMHTAEYLYTSGYISYPRTESSRYPDAFEFRPLLEVQAGHPQWGSAARDVLAGKTICPTNSHAGIDAGDHPPITPVALCAAGDVGGDASRLYELITRHFIATLSPSATWLRTTVHVDIGGEEFTVGGRSDVKLGWLAVVTYVPFGLCILVLVAVSCCARYGGGKSELHLPAMEEGEDVTVQGIHMTQKMTEPPEMLSESDLITLMEQHKIGTDASIATHINNIQERNYVRCEAGRRLVPTKLGIALCHGSVCTNQSAIFCV
jgi:DNA topoisomerase-3